MHEDLTDLSNFRIILWKMEQQVILQNRSIKFLSSKFGNGDFRARLLDIDTKLKNLQAELGTAGPAIDDDPLYRPTLWRYTAEVSDALNNMLNDKEHFSMDNLEIKLLETVRDNMEEITNLVTGQMGALNLKEISRVQSDLEALKVRSDVKFKTASLRYIKTKKELAENKSETMTLKKNLAKMEKKLLSGNYCSAASSKPARTNKASIYQDSDKSEDDEDEKKRKGDDKNWNGGMGTLKTMNLKTSDTSLQEQINSLKIDVGKLKAVSPDAKCIKFCNLGLESLKQTIAWVKENFDPLRFGLVPCPYTTLNGCELDVEQNAAAMLSKMEKQNKLKLKTLSETASLVALGSAVPTIFHKTSLATRTAHTPGTSYLNCMKTHDDWTAADFGVKDLIQKNLPNVINSYNLDISAVFSVTSMAHAVCSNAASKTSTWVTRLSAFIEDTYNSLTTYNSCSSWCRPCVACRTANCRYRISHSCLVITNTCGTCDSAWCSW